MNTVVKLDGIGHDCPITLNTALLEADIGKVVSLSPSVAKTAILGADNGEGFGVLMSVDEVNDICAVETRGWHRVGYSGSAPALGYTTLLVDGAGKFKAGAGRSYYIAEVDTTNTEILVYFG